MSTRSNIIILLLTLSLVSVFSQQNIPVDTRSIIQGETLNYKATWGFLTIGTGYTRIDSKLHSYDKSTCYKVEILGMTNGLAKLFNVHDQWISYVDTANIATHKSFRSIREGRHALDEIVHFDQRRNRAQVFVKDKLTQQFKLKDIYKISSDTRDVVAGFMAFRFVDLSKYSKGQTFSIDGFYEDEAYKIKVVFEGIEKLKVSGRTMNCYKLRPVVPQNKVFNGHDSVVVWIAANSTKEIIRIKAKMFVGDIIVDLQS